LLERGGGGHDTDRVALSEGLGFAKGHREEFIPGRGVGESVSQ
jgi:hypothetical protein